MTIQDKVLYYINMSPELVVRRDPDPGIPAEPWQLPAEVAGDLKKAALEGRTITVTTEDVGFTGFGTSPMARRVTTRIGIVTEVEPGGLVMEIKSGLIFTQVADTPERDIKQLSESDGRVVIPVFREFRGWEEQTRGEEGVPEASEDDPVTSTEYIAAISVEDGRGFSFYPPSPHLRFY